jgi:hypothetical protein
MQPFNFGIVGGDRPDFLLNGIFESVNVFFPQFFVGFKQSLLL